MLQKPTTRVVRQRREELSSRRSFVDVLEHVSDGVQVFIVERKAAPDRDRIADKNKRPPLRGKPKPRPDR